MANLLLLTLLPISITILLLALVVATAAAVWYKRSRVPTMAADDVEKSHPTVTAKVSDTVRKHTWEEIQAMTTGFSTTVIAHGGYSTVYLAATGDPPTAVKVHNASDRLHTAFLRELDILRHVRHANVVRLTGFSDYGNEQGALVFEYVPNGTLHERLHGGGPPLAWAHRMRIALQLAVVLEYLHEGCKLQIVHNDIKPSNILLDGELNCKLCDFGSAKMGFSSTVEGATERRRQITGTAGYVDPYYVRTGVVSRKSDVYSFGVVLLEMMSGREAFREETGEALARAMRGAMQEATQGRVGEMVDATLEGVFDVEEAAAVARVAEGCVADEPSGRPTMGEVVRMLTEKVGQSTKGLDGRLKGVDS